MGPERPDWLHPPDPPTPPRDRAEAERRIARADQAIDGLRAEIRDARYRYQQYERYCEPRRRAIPLWGHEKGVCRDFLKEHPAPGAGATAATAATAASPPAPLPPPPPRPAAPPPAAAPPPPTALPLPALADLQRIEAFLDDGIRAAANEKRRRLSTPVEVAVEHLAIIRRYTLSLSGGNVLPLRPRTG